MLLNDPAGDQWVSVEPARQRWHAHAVIDPQLERLHALPHIVIMLLPVRWIRVLREAAHQCERVIDVPLR